MGPAPAPAAPVEPVVVAARRRPACAAPTPPLHGAAPTPRRFRTRRSAGAPAPSTPRRREPVHNAELHAARRAGDRPAPGCAPLPAAPEGRRRTSRRAGSPVHCAVSRPAAARREGGKRDARAGTKGRRECLAAPGAAPVPRRFRASANPHSPWSAAWQAARRSGNRLTRRAASRSDAPRGAPAQSAARQRPPPAAYGAARRLAVAGRRKEGVSCGSPAR